MKLNSPLFDRIRVKRAAEEPVVRARAARVPVAGLRGGRHAPRAEGPRPRRRVSALLPRPCARIQPVLQLLRRHERRRGGRLAEGRGHRPPPDLEDGRQRFSRQRDTRRRPPSRPASSPSATRSGCSAPARPRRRSPRRARRTIRNGERKALAALDLDIDATREEIKARFKTLAKRHHPDVNGGDTSSEDRLRDIISAYNYLKGAGLC